MNKFTSYNESAVSKLKTRETRLKLSQNFVRQLKTTAINVVSLPGFYGRYEKALLPFIRRQKKRVTWVSFEIKKSLWGRRFNPFGRGYLTLEDNNVKTNQAKDLSYVHSPLSLSLFADQKNVPMLVDADFCGTLSNQILEECVDHLARNSLVMFTFYTQWRGWKTYNNLPCIAAKLIRTIVNKGLLVTAEDLENAYIQAIEHRMKQKGIPFTFLGKRGYMNDGNRDNGIASPMVLLAWHTVPSSPLANSCNDLYG